MRFIGKLYVWSEVIFTENVCCNQACNMRPVMGLPILSFMANDQDN